MLQTKTSSLKSVVGVLRAAVLVLCAVAIASCTTTAPRQPQPSPAPSAPAPAPAVPSVVDVPDEPAIPINAETARLIEELNREGSVPQADRAGERAPRVQVQGNNTIALNLEQEDLRRVFEILGGALNLNMIIDPGINAVVSVRTTENNPLTYDDIWPLMRALARSSNVAIEQLGDTWRFYASQERVPTQIAMPNWLGETTASEVLQVTPLRFITREQVAQIIAPLLQDNGAILNLGPRNLIGIAGAPGLLERINALLEVVDSDPFQNQGIKVYSLRYTQATDVAAELTAVMALIQGAEIGVYQALPLSRINAVLVIGSAGRGFEEVDRWMAILDNEVQGQAEQLFVYQVKNLDAGNLADTLGSVFGQTPVVRPQPAAETNPLFNLAPGAPAAQQGAAQQGAAQQVVIGPGGGPAVLVAPGGGAAAPGAAANQAGGGAGGVSADLAVTIVPDADTNSLLIRGSPRDFRALMTVIRRLDAAPKQVMINAVIGQATLNEGHAYGVDWLRVSENLANGPAQLSTRFLPGGLFNQDGSPAPGSGLVLTRTFGNSQATIDAVFQAIASDNEVTLLAKPTIMAANNQEGEIVVGQEVPVESGSTVAGNGTVSSNIAYRDVGIVLTITPHINEDGLINLEIFQSLSSIEDVAGGVNDNPIFTNQEITTTAIVADGALITLGGLIQTESGKQNTGIPGLRRIPGLKALFSYTENSAVRRELFVVLHPQVIDGDEEARIIQRQFREKFEVLRGVLEDMWGY